MAAYLRDAAGYRTALVGKAHFEPAFDMTGKWEENNRARRGDTGPWRGFDYSIQAAHVAAFRGRPVQHFRALAPPVPPRAPRVVLRAARGSPGR